MVLGGSSSAPNLQDYARANRKKLTSSGFLDGMCRHAHISWRKKDQQIIFIIKTTLIVHRLKIHFAVICIVFPSSIWVRSFGQRMFVVLPFLVLLFVVAIMLGLSNLLIWFWTWFLRRLSSVFFSCVWSCTIWTNLSLELPGYMCS